MNFDAERLQTYEASLKLKLSYTLCVYCCFVNEERPTDQNSHGAVVGRHVSRNADLTSPIKDCGYEGQKRGITQDAKCDDRLSPCFDLTSQQFPDPKAHNSQHEKPNHKAADNSSCRGAVACFSKLHNWWCNSGNEVT